MYKTLENILDFGGPTGISYEIGSFYFEPTWMTAFLIVLMLFLLIYTLARIRYLYIHWSAGKSGLAFLFWGFLLALIVEGFFIIGGRTILTEFLGWKNPPKPVGKALDIGREKLVDVLGVGDEIKESIAGENLSRQEILFEYENLSSMERTKLQEEICK